MQEQKGLVIETQLDNEKLEKDLAKLKKDIADLEDAISNKQTEESPLVEQAKNLADNIHAAHEEAEKFKKDWMSGIVGADKDWTAAQEKELGYKAQYNEVLAKLDKSGGSINGLLAKLTAAKKEAGELELHLQSIANEKISESVEGTEEKLSRVQVALQKLRARFSGLTAQIKKITETKKISKLGDAFDTVGKRVTSLMKRVFVFTTILSALRAIKNWFGEVIKTNDEAVSAVSQLKGALLTMAQPLVNVVLPAFTVLVQALTKVVSILAQLFSRLAGTTVEASKAAAQALYEETEALNATGAAADDAAGSLAGFDEINTVSDNSGASANANLSAADFDFETIIPEENLDHLLGVVSAIGTAFLAWKISSALGTGLLSTVGLVLAIYSAGLLVSGVFSAWNDGLDTSNITKMLVGTAGLALGLYIAFGAVGAGIGLLVAGLAILGVSFKDADENGWNLKNTLMAMAGILIAGAGIGLLVGSWIPLLIAAIVAVVLAFVNLMGHGDELIDGLKGIFGGLIDFIVGIFTGDLDKAIGGIEKLFDGLKTFVGAIFNSLIDLFDSGFLKPIGIAFNLLKDLFNSVVDGIKQVLSGLIKFIVGVFSGDWQMAWEGIKDIFKGIFNTLIGIVESVANAVIRGLNWIISGLNKISFTVPDWVPEIGGRQIGGNIKPITELSIPRLATGAVIPPNREFLAILGDQKAGTNIEAPLATIKQAFVEAMAELSGAGGEQTIIVQCLLDGRKVAENSVKHINAMTVQAGKPVLVT